MCGQISVIARGDGGGGDWGGGGEDRAEGSEGEMCKEVSDNLNIAVGA